MSRVGGGAGLLRGLFQLHRPAVVVELVEGFVQAAPRPGGAARIGQEGGQQPGREAGHFQPELRLQRRQAAHHAGGDEQQGGEEAGLRPHQDAVAGQDVSVPGRVEMAQQMPGNSSRARSRRSATASVSAHW